jgi:hypothetical protein
MDWQKVQEQDKVRRSRDVPVLDTFGEKERCWCGQPFRHYWPGQEDGAEHPREGQADE